MTQTCDTTISGSLKSLTKALEDGAKAGIGVLQSMTGSAPAALDNPHWFCNPPRRVHGAALFVMFLRLVGCLVNFAR